MITKIQRSQQHKVMFKLLASISLDAIEGNGEMQWWAFISGAVIPWNVLATDLSKRELELWIAIDFQLSLPGSGITV